MSDYQNILDEIHNNNFNQSISPSYCLDSWTIARKLDKIHEECIKVIRKIERKYSNNFFNGNFRMIYEVGSVDRGYTTTIQGYYFICSYFVEEGYQKNGSYVAVKSSKAKSAIRLYTELYKMLKRDIEENIGFRR